MAAIPASVILQLLSNDPKWTAKLGARPTQKWAERISGRDFLEPVHSTQPPYAVVGWLARDRVGTLTYFVDKSHTGKDAQGRRKNDLPSVIAAARNSWPWSWGFVMPWNRESRKFAKQNLRGGFLGVFFL